MCFNLDHLHAKSTGSFHSCTRASLDIFLSQLTVLAGNMHLSNHCPCRLHAFVNPLSLQATCICQSNSFPLLGLKC